MLIKGKTIIFIVFFICILVLFTKKILFKIIKRKFNMKKEIIHSIFIFYLFFLLSITVFPIILNFPFLKGEIINPNYILTSKMNIIIFQDYLTAFKSLDFNFFKDIFLNITLFIPLIFYLALTDKNNFNLLSAILIGVLSSIFLEGLQLLFNLLKISATLNVVSIDQIILNTITAILGYYIFKGIMKTRIKYLLNLDHNIFIV